MHDRIDAISHGANAKKMDRQNQFHDRGKALEDAFFSRVDQKLLQNLKASLESEDRRSSLGEVTGIESLEVLDQLIEVGATPESLVAVSIIPVVEVAWADGKLDQKEAAAIREIAHGEGIDQGSSGRQLLECWLNESPDSALYDAWYAYVSSIREILPSDKLNELRDSIVSHAQHVAKASGAKLGLNAISASEKSVLKRIEGAFRISSA